MVHGFLLAWIVYTLPLGQSQEFLNSFLKNEAQEKPAGGLPASLVLWMANN
ncbi:hypothetical protein SORDD17_01130 [Streptococcus oralis]|uniref:Uncharacterized protein n=1 Tax=Streptococcus oralis TaxID=1303 RepID=A0A139RKZ1_STROR|nr:hypothetical protein SORDD17_01130 [Streptococcus oralis]